nr:retrovirus-related Pol polyprotein from transposon TNT 1-94 [Tanacetum cinerariifolium]
MHALLIQHGCEAALEVLPADMEAQAKAQLNKKAHSAMILCLGLYVRGRTDRRDSCQSRGKSRSKSRGGRLKCYICQSEDHLKRNCPKNNRKKSSGSARLDHGFRRYIPELKRNLISLGTLEKEGYTVKLHSGKIKVINGSMVVLFETRRDNSVYSLDGHAVADELNASVEEKDRLAQIWHKRLGYISEAGLHVLEKQGLFGKKSLVASELNASIEEKDSLAQVWHKRLGHIGGTTGVGKAGSVWQEESRFKHEAFEKFKEWKQLVENQTGRTVKKLRTDNGLEFCN